MPRPFILAPIAPIALIYALALVNCASPASDPSSKGDEPVGETASALTTTCVQIQRGAFGTVTDTAVDSSRNTTNYGASTALSAGIVDGATRYVTLRFDVSAIPASAAITSATLGMSLYSSSTGAGTLNAHRITSAWAESTITWSAFNGSFDPSVVATSPNSAPSFDLTRLAAQWVGGAVPNYGVLIEQSTYKTLFNASETYSASARPFLKVCYDLCTDGLKNGSETGVDCGGSCTTKCAVGTGCSANGDCQTGLCAAGVCQAVPSCTDGLKNGSETGVDCGGSCTTKCAVGTGCSANGDCQTGLCAAGVCQAVPSCTDGLKNGSETGVDCGGSCTTKCAVGTGCSANGDCQTGLCAAGVCQAVPATPPCSDGVKGGLETDVDCGGGVCASCSIGNACLIDEDCVTGSCQSGVCQALSAVASGCTVPAISPNLTAISDLVYSTPVGYGASYANKLDIYRLNDNLDRPLVVFIHGGGWHGGKKVEASVITNCQLLASLGYVCAAIDYRLDTTSATQTVPAFSPIHEADTRCAVRWLRNNAAAYHIDASRIFSMGISAGAHLAVSLAIDSEIGAFDDGSCSTATSAKVNGAIGSFGVYDLRPSASSTWGDPSSPAPPDISNFIHGGDAALASPILHIDRQDSPLLFLHGSADWVLYPVASQNMLNAAMSAGVAATMWTEPNASHGYHWWDPGYEGSACTLLNFLAKTAPKH